MSLGSLFGTEKILGPVCVNYCKWQDRDIFFIGEVHELNGDRDGSKDDYVIEHLKKACRTSKVRCYYEGTPQHAHNASIILNVLSKQHNEKNIYRLSDNPTMSYGYFAWNQQFPRSLENIYADLRRTAPYILYTLVYDPQLFALEKYGIFMDNHMPKVRKLAKKIEKVFLRKLSTRQKAQEVLNALVLPEYDYPHWFRKLYEEAYEDKTPPPSFLKENIAKLSPENYQRLKLHIHYYHTKWAVTPFTKAMMRFEGLRVSASSRVIGQVNNTAKDLFIEMFTFLLDIYVITDILNRPPEANEIIVALTGAQHTENLTRFFAQDSTQVLSKWDATGNIPEGPARESFGEIPGKIKEKLMSICNLARDA
jgi:hypothetical protein